MDACKVADDRKWEIQNLNFKSDIICSSMPQPQFDLVFKDEIVVSDNVRSESHDGDYIEGLAHMA